MKRRKIAILVAAAAFAALMAAVVFQWKRGKSGPIGTVSLETLLAPFRAAGEGLVQKGFEFEHTRTREGRKVFTIHAAHMLNFSSGVQRLENVEAVLYGESGDVIVLSEQADYESGSGRLHLRGNVRVKDSEGMEAVTDEMLYEEATGLAISHSPVRLVRGAMQGLAQKLSYDSHKGLLVLEGGVNLDSKNIPFEEASNRPVVFHAHRMEYFRNQNFLLAYGEAPASPLSGLEAWKNACAGFSSLPGPEDARRYDGWSPMVRVVFRGEELDRIETSEAVRVEIRETPASVPMVMEGVGMDAVYEAENRRFHSMNLHDRASFHRPAAALETAKAEETSKQTADVSRAGWSAKARCADFNLTEGSLLLVDDAEIRSGAYTVRGDTQVLSQSEERIDSYGTAQVVIRQDAGLELPGSEGRSSEPVYAYADEVTIWNNPRLAEFRRAAVLRHGEDTVSAELIWSDLEKNILEAQGNVTTRIMSAEEGRMRPTFVAAQSLRYDDAAKLAAYRGGCTLSRDDLSVRSKRMDAWFKPEGAGKTGIDKVRAEEEVTLESPGRIGRGDWAEYYFDRQEAVLGGEREIEVQETDTGRIARGLRLTYGVSRNSLGIYTDSYGRTVSATRPASAGSEDGEKPPAPSGGKKAPVEEKRSHKLETLPELAQP